MGGVSAGDRALCAAVREELDWDPMVDNSAIVVTAAGGVVRLDGVVGSFAEKCEVVQDVLAVAGVADVVDAMEVQLLEELWRTDPSVRDDVARALELNHLVPCTIDVHVLHGWVTLGGTAGTRQQIGEAEGTASRVRGVVGISSEVEVVPFDTDDTAAPEAIVRAIQRRTGAEAEAIVIGCLGDAVVLGGSVRSASTRAAVASSVWRAPGVRTVIDDLHVLTEQTLSPRPGAHRPTVAPSPVETERPEMGWAGVEHRMVGRAAARLGSLAAQLSSDADAALAPPVRRLFRTTSELLVALQDAFRHAPAEHREGC